MKDNLIDYDKSHDEGYALGYDEGFEEGYHIGFAEGEKCAQGEEEMEKGDKDV